MIANFILLALLTYKNFYPDGLVSMAISFISGVSVSQTSWSFSELSFWFVTISCIIPTSFMFLTKICRKFAFGHADEDIDQENGGRLDFLEKEWDKTAQSVIDSTVLNIKPK